jgi:alkylation response protein AidB-like acyl-CoA dehydrogenase
LSILFPVEFGWTDEDLAYRKEIRAFLDVELAGQWSGEVTQTGSKANVEFARQFCGKLAERGWLTPHWPAEYGGSDSSHWRHTILGEEMWSIGEPRGPQYMNVNWIGPSIMASGTDEQKREHLPPIARGEVVWCQGFSEPEAGSDLASLRTRAERDGGEYVVNGQKTWTSFAEVADYCYLLARTDPTSKRQHGISVLLVPTSTPGFEVRSIPAVVGEHAFHEVFLTDMRVPVSCRLGPEHEGWDVVRRALTYERVGAPRWARAALVLDQLAAWVLQHGLADDVAVLDRLGHARALCEAARLLAYRVIDEHGLDRPPPANSSLARVAMVRAEREVGFLAMELMGADGLENGSLADHALRKSMAAGVAAGTVEVQLNLIARLVLGLPKE